MFFLAPFTKHSEVSVTCCNGRGKLTSKAKSVNHFGFIIAKASKKKSGCQRQQWCTINGSGFHTASLLKSSCNTQNFILLFTTGSSSRKGFRSCKICTVVSSDFSRYYFTNCMKNTCYARRLWKKTKRIDWEWSVPLLQKELNRRATVPRDRPLTRRFKALVLQILTSYKSSKHNRQMPTQQVQPIYLLQHQQFIYYLVS